MSKARLDSAERLRAIRRSVADFNLQDWPFTPANTAHNASVRIIRNGLAVQTFNVLEDFVKARTNEILTDLCASGIPFRNLPQGLQKAATIDAVEALKYRIGLQDKSDKIAFAQDHSRMIASTNAAGMQITDLAFFSASSNIRKQQYVEALKAFAIQEPWAHVTRLLSRMRMSGVPAETLFESIATRRHAAAHNAGASISESDLLQTIKDAFGLAIGFDVLISLASRVIVTSGAAFTSGSVSLAANAAIPLRYISPHPRGFTERSDGASRNSRVGASLSALVANAVVRAQTAGGALVVFESLGSVSEWHV